MLLQLTTTLKVFTVLLPSRRRHEVLDLRNR